MSLSRLLVAFASIFIVQISFAQNNDDVRITKTGAKFYKDTSNSSMGEAFRDPSGLVWSTLRDFKNGHERSTWMNYEQAVQYCKERNARLPNENEAEQLSVYLGKKPGSEFGDGYSAFVQGSKTIEVLKGLHDSIYWIVTGRFHGNNRGPAYSDGSFTTQDTRYPLGVVCVMKGQ